MKLRGKDVLVVGFGASGRAACRLLLHRGAQVLVYDQRVEHRLQNDIESFGARALLGPATIVEALTFDLIILSPGVPLLPELARAAERGIPVWGETELALRHVADDCTLIAVTGTNGKSTTTTMIGKMCQQAGRKTFIGGNLGIPLSQAILDGYGQGSTLVLELSSFQLQHIHSLHAHIAVITNITPDHLNRHETWEEYVACKARIFSHQTSSDYAVVSHSDPLTLGLVGDATVATFGAAGTVRIDADAIRCGNHAIRRNRLVMQESHHVANAAAAICVAIQLNIPWPLIESVVHTCKRLPHRNQMVGEIGGVYFYDDAKATNVAAAAATLRDVSPISSRVVLIAGGNHKGGSYGPLKQTVKARCRAVVLVGESTPLLVEALGDGEIPVYAVETFDQAFAAAVALAQPSDIVLLAPACSTFDQFPSFEHHGKHFAALVGQLELAP